MFEVLLCTFLYSCSQEKIQLQIPMTTILADSIYLYLNCTSTLRIVLHRVQLLCSNLFSSFPQLLSPPRNLSPSSRSHPLREQDHTPLPGSFTISTSWWVSYTGLVTCCDLSCSTYSPLLSLCCLQTRASIVHKYSKIMHRQRTSSFGISK